MPTTAAKKDWSAWTAKSIRSVVKARSCPECGAKKGQPCKNKLAGLVDPTARKRQQRPYYQNYIHAKRRKAA